jgi:hypothetical protein
MVSFFDIGGLFSFLYERAFVPTVETNIDRAPGPTETLQG